MKTVDIFASVMDQAFQDTQTRRYGAILLARGVGGVAKSGEGGDFGEIVENVSRESRSG